MASDVAAFETDQAAYKKEVDTTSAALQSKVDQYVATQEATGAAEVAAAKAFQTSQQPFNVSPPTDQIQQVMAGAPWLFALAAIGGKISGAGGIAMLDSLNGMSDGLIKGDQQALENNYKNYNAQFQKWKATADQQVMIYDRLREAYKDQADGNLRAHTTALQITGDLTARKLAVDDPGQYYTTVSQLKLADAKIAEAYAKAKQIQQGGEITPRMRQIEAVLSDLGVPGFSGRGAKVNWDRIRDLDAAHPNDDPMTIGTRVKHGAQGYKLENVELSVAGKKEAAIGQAMEALNMPNGLWDQIEGVAKTVNFGSVKSVNDLELIAQGKLKANKDIQAYVTKVVEGRAELSQIFSRGGLATDETRHEAERLIPFNLSYDEILASRKANTEASAAVRRGSDRYIQSIMDPKSVGGTPGATIAPPETGTDTDGKQMVKKNGVWVYPAQTGAPQ